MKIAAVSDLHVDVNGDYAVFDTLGRLLASLKADMLLVAGDISECCHTTISWIKDFESAAKIPVYYVPGNHDLWRCGDLGNDEIYSMYSSDPRCLCGKSIPLGRSWTVVGDAGWYDYTLSPLESENVDLDSMTYGGRTWQDKLRNSWSGDNKGRTDMMLDSLDRVLSLSDGKNVIAVTHMLVNDDFIVRGRGRMWDYFDAFLGSKEFGKLFMRHCVKYSISGHVHFRKEAFHDGTRFICPCLGYSSEWGLFDEKHGDDVFFQLSSSLKLIEI